MWNLNKINNNNNKSRNKLIDTENILKATRQERVGGDKGKAKGLRGTHG